MGLGLHGGGVGVTKYLVQKGARVTVTDLKNKQELSSSLKKLSKLPIRYVLGKHRLADFKNCDLIIKNPGVPNNSKFLAVAKKNDIPVLMDINLFWRSCPSQNIIGITGTKGKTTTAHLVKKILDQAGFKNVLAGNLGVSFLTVLPKIDPKTWVVLELSSWQLEGLREESFSPTIALITNIFPDHLNRYQNMADYLSAKKIIFAHQKKTDYLLLNKKNPWSSKIAKEAPGKVVFFSKKDLNRSWQKKIKLPGKHNLNNVAAAAKIADLLKIEKDLVIEATSNFRGLPHRLELVNTISGISFYNDSAATNPTAAEAAITTLDKPFIWILGGADKKLQFNKLFKTAKKTPHLKGLVFLEGKATSKIIKEVKKNLPKVPFFGPLNKMSLAIKTAYQLAETGDIILLSPATASFGLFKNEFDRGRQFKKTVNALAKKTQKS